MVIDIDTLMMGIETDTFTPTAEIKVRFNKKTKKVEVTAIEKEKKETVHIDKKTVENTVKTGTVTDEKKTAVIDKDVKRSSCWFMFWLGMAIGVGGCVVIWFGIKYLKSRL